MDYKEMMDELDKNPKLFKKLWEEFTKPGGLYYNSQPESCLINQAREALLDVIRLLPSCDRVKDLPLKKGLYFLLTHNTHQLWYVGISQNIRTRWKNHSLKRLVRSKMCYLRWKVPSDEFNGIEHEEAAYIAMLDPPLNRVVNQVLINQHNSKNLEEFVSSDLQDQISEMEFAMNNYKRQRNDAQEL